MITAKEMRKRAIRLRNRFDDQISVIESEIKEAANNGKVNIIIPDYQLFQFSEIQKFRSKDFQDMIIEYFSPNGFIVKFQATELYISW